VEETWWLYIMKYKYMAQNHLPQQKRNCADAGKQRYPQLTWRPFPKPFCLLHKLYSNGKSIEIPRKRRRKRAPISPSSLNLD